MRRKRAEYNTEWPSMMQKSRARFRGDRREHSLEIALELPRKEGMSRGEKDLTERRGRNEQREVGGRISREGGRGFLIIFIYFLKILWLHFIF